MRKVSFCLFVAAWAISSVCPAQNTVTKSNADSTVQVTQDARLDDLIKRQKNANQLKQTMPGYRIQIYFGGVRQKASEIKIDFAEKHSDIPAYITYQQPNFKVRVGDFRTRLEAQKLLKSMEGEFTTMFIVQDEVKLPSLEKAQH
jgi:hypothetical protein